MLIQQQLGNYLDSLVCSCLEQDLNSQTGGTCGPPQLDSRIFQLLVLEGQGCQGTGLMTSGFALGVETSQMTDQKGCQVKCIVGFLWTTLWSFLMNTEQEDSLHQSSSVLMNQSVGGMVKVDSG